ncbi:hypothetical protein [Actinokineospora cianjurensis]|uniref:Uncharacterized protein n=1 Tax=Actinokineospora cianjurensis TaxID=585224 RepID=A0A421B282_9PSEU|nr:hypothetical protein [Actinokineospora cianjurensis]RLK58502.1 hypothetical protein CLV68_2969 [Actinokineospora cianjurensis]
MDFETASAAEPEYDLRAFPDVEVLTATVRHYERLSGQVLSIDRIMAWHLRATRFAALDVHP